MSVKYIILKWIPYAGWDEAFSGDEEACVAFVKTLKKRELDDYSIYAETSLDIDEMAGRSTQGNL